MANHEGWTELKLPYRSECPKLFYCFANEDDQFELFLTDLMGIWNCSMSRNTILNAAKEQNSSIDPSESSTQTKVLILKLRDSLKAGNNVLFRDKKLSSGVINIRTKFRLPKPLKSLEWTFTLLPQGAGEMAEQILRPCLHEASSTKKKMESLLRTIKDKDHVISKLLDQIEQSSTDLSLIFPGMTGLRGRKGRVTVDEARKHVPGMEHFDETTLSSQFDSNGSYNRFTSRSLENLVSGSERCPKHTVTQHEAWLKQLPDDKGTVLQDFSMDRGESKDQARSRTDVSDDTTTDSTANHDDDDDDDDFERQATPPKSTSPARRKADQDLERPNKRPKLGRLGKRAKSTTLLQASNGDGAAPGSSKQDLESSSTRPSTPSTVPDSDGGTKSPSPSPDLKSPPGQISNPIELKSTRNNVSPSSAESTPSPPIKPSTPSRRLGRLGSKSNDNSPSSQVSPHKRSQKNKTNDENLIRSPFTKPAERTDAPTPSRRRLGRLGSSRSQSQVQPDNSPQPSPTPNKNRPTRHRTRAIDSDTNATQSDASSSSSPISLSMDRLNQRSQQKNPDSHPETDSQSVNAPSQPEPIPEPAQKEETIEEKANRRREQLKQTITSTTNKRKRKF